MNENGPESAITASVSRRSEGKLVRSFTSSGRNHGVIIELHKKSNQQRQAKRTNSYSKKPLMGEFHSHSSEQGVLHLSGVINDGPVLYDALTRQPLRVAYRYRLHWTCCAGASHLSRASYRTVAHCTRIVLKFVVSEARLHWKNARNGLVIVSVTPSLQCLTFSVVFCSAREAFLDQNYRCCQGARPPTSPDWRRRRGVRSGGSTHSLRRYVDPPRCEQNPQNRYAEGGVGESCSRKKKLLGSQSTHFKVLAKQNRGRPRRKSRGLQTEQVAQHKVGWDLQNSLFNTHGFRRGCPKSTRYPDQIRPSSPLRRWLILLYGP